MAFSDGHAEEAATAFEKTRQLGERTGMKKLLALALAGNGSLAAAAGKFPEALALKHEALEAFRSIGDKWIVGYSLWGVAQAALALEDAGTAHQALAEWARITRELRNRWATPYLLQLLADTARLEGKPELAARIFGAAELQREKFGIRFAPAERSAYEHSLARLDAVLDPEVRRTHWNAGRHLRPDAALEMAVAMD